MLRQKRGLVRGKTGGSEGKPGEKTGKKLHFGEVKPSIHAGFQPSSN